MLKGKLKYIGLGIGIFVLAFGIMRYTPLAFGNSNNMENFQESRPFYERFMRGPIGPRGPRDHHRRMWDYEGEEDWEESRQDRRNFRGPRGCMGYYYDDYEFDEGIGK